MQDDRPIDNRRLEIRLPFSQEGLCKADFDGEAMGNLGLAGCGGVIRNNFGHCMAVVTLPLGIKTNPLTEVMASLQVTKLAKDIGVTRLWLQGDSMNIIKCLIGLSIPSWTIDNIIKETKGSYYNYG